MTKEDKSDLKKLLYHIESDPSTGHIGMSEKLIDIDKRVTTIEINQIEIQARNKILYRVGVGVGGVATFVIGKSWNLIVASIKAVI